MYNSTELAPLESQLHAVQGFRQHEPEPKHSVVAQVSGVGLASSWFNECGFRATLRLSGFLCLFLFAKLDISQCSVYCEDLDAAVTRHLVQQSQLSK